MKCPYCDKEIEIKFANPCHVPYTTPVAKDGLPGIAIHHDAVFSPEEGKWYGLDADRKNSEMES